MSALREAAQRALEAMEAMQSYAAAERKGLLICDESITALRAALAQEEQEPAAWMLEDVDKRHFIFRAVKPVAREWEKLTPLYTHPPRREWQSLSEEEIDWLLEAERMKWAKNSPPTYEFAPAFARAIEAKLKEKNND